MKQKSILVITIALFSVCLLGNVLAANTKVVGNVNLVWNNYGSYPQDLTGTISGDLSGTISVLSNSLYDSSNPTVGLTNGDITAVIDGVNCDGVYAGSNINSGVDTGSFTLVCDDKFYNGILYGTAKQDSNGLWTIMDLKYEAFSLQSIPGPKGDKGDTGAQGEQGIQGPSGEKGDKGEQGLQGIQGEQGLPGKDGVNGKDGLNGVNGIDGKDGLPGKDGTNGIDGLPGIQGPKGDQGEQGIQGIKGDTGAVGPVGPQGPAGDTGATGTCTCDLTQVNNQVNHLNDVINSLFQYNPDFLAYFTNGGQCINGQFRCSGDVQQKCINYAWVNQQTCQYGCENSNCKQAPIVCSINSQCGTDVFTGSLVCQNNNVYQNKLTFKCNNPGTSQSSCSSSNVLTLKETCSNGCTNGVCNPTPNKEDCTQKTPKGVCVNNNKHSAPLTWKCTSGQGTNTACNPGKCYSIQSYAWNVCSLGCNPLTGLCK